MRRTAWLIVLAFPVLSAAAFAQSAPTVATAPATTTTTAPSAGSAATGQPAPVKHEGMKQKWQAKFDSANTSHDGHLTLAQAQTAGWTKVASNFAAIDSEKRGYVTFNQLVAWRLQAKASKMQQQAAALNAQN